MTQKRARKKKKSYRLRWPAIFMTALLVVLIALGLVLLLRSFSKTTASAKTSISSSPASANTSQTNSGNSGLKSLDGKTYLYRNGVKQTGFQTVDGKNYYFDPATAAEVGQMRPMTGNYWQESSMLQPYPDLSQYNNLSITVSTTQQRVYFKSGTQTIYVMYASTGGSDGSTPTGTYAVQSKAYWGATFYNASEGEGANYAVSWLDDGLYLFHSVPIDANGNYILSQATLLGQSAASHGCVRLSVADSQWLYDNIQVGTPVTIE
jgi:lipoprotein-anchoring transpeptidase ErfK/SrfK